MSLSTNKVEYTAQMYNAILRERDDLLRENAELWKDKERLDWVERSNLDVVFDEGDPDVGLPCSWLVGAQNKQIARESGGHSRSHRRRPRGGERTTMSDTPRTDNEVVEYDYLSLSGEHRTGEYVDSSFARQLERELNTERQRAEKAEAGKAEQGRNACELFDEVKRLHSELAEARKDTERLDWLDKIAIPFRWISPESIDSLPDITLSWRSNDSLRKAIDAAREARKGGA